MGTRGALPGLEARPVRSGDRDVPPWLLPPSRLVGRDAEVAALQAAFEAALAGRCRSLLVAGAPGVGKTALIDQLRPVVTRSGGWFVAGKSDPYRRDLEFDAVNQALRALGRLVLAQPETELGEVRERVLAAVGANAGLLTATVPEFATLLRTPPDAGDPLTAQARAQRAAAEALRAVASRRRPVVVFLDDLQWAGRPPLGFVDLVLAEEPIEGLLLVGAYRDDAVDAVHPLEALLSRARERSGVLHLRLHDLPEPGLRAMVADLLRVEVAAVASLAEVIYPHTSGNPYETLELLTALRHLELLTATGAGWRWDTDAVRTHLARSDVGELLAARLAATPSQTREIVEAMACLGGRATVSVLQVATGEPADALDQALAPALDEGVLVVEAGAHEAVRFRHDRIREAVLRRLVGRKRAALQLAMARRLAAVPEMFAVAAEQYLPVIDAVDDVAERRQVVQLLRRAADQARLIGDYALVNTLLAAALRLVDPGETTTLVDVHTGRHAALFSLGRLGEADDEYDPIIQLCPSVVQRVDATCLQLRSLTHRNRFADAIALGVESLRELGIAVPTDRSSAELDHHVDLLYRWLDHTEVADDLARPEITDPALLAAGRLISVVLSASYFALDHPTHMWMSLEAVQIWLEHGPSRSLFAPVSHTGMAAAALRGDHTAGYRAATRLVALGEACGYEPETSQTRLMSAVYGWCTEPIETAVQAARSAREGLLAGGDLAYAGYTYQPAVPGLLDSAPSLDEYVSEVEAGSAFLRRTGNERTLEALDGHRWLAGVLLRGERTAAAGEAVPVDWYADNALALFEAHVTRAIAAAVFSDPAGLARHTEAAMPLLPAAEGLYVSARAYLLRGLALAEQTRVSDCADRGALLTELDEVTRWVAARSTDAPDNFLHLLRLLEAERAWAVGDFRAAVLAFDAARREVAGRRRPWHQALIAERAARFHLAHGMEDTGHELLAQAREVYAAWGATPKVAQLGRAYPTLRAEAGTTNGLRDDRPHRRPTVTTGTMDLLGILSASQALSSETSIERLHARVVEVLSAMTGATGVHLLLWSDDHHDWLQPALAPGDTGCGPAAPMSVLRHVQRTGEPLVVADATRDDRFAPDPYLTDLDCCSLLALPIFSRGTPRAVLLLEHRLIRGAFTTDRLDAVKLIAGQLAVSLDNARLYAELTTSRARIVTAADRARRRIERDLHDGAQQRLISLTEQARAARSAVPPRADELRVKLDALADEATSALAELRELAHGIHPATLADGGLRPALQALARRSPVPVRLTVPDGRLPERIEIAAYYLIAESLTNTAKHAHAKAVTITLDTDPADTVLRVRVSDDGRGGAHLTGGSGLVGLKDRVETVGGRLIVQSPPGAGTTVHAELPLHPDRAVRR